MHVSIVVPLKNKAQEINRCIDSILLQTHKDFELIIVDGNSTDGSLEIVLMYHDERIKIINQRSKGAAAGRNEGILASKGDLIAFLDADDEYLPEFLEIIINLAEHFPEAGMYGTKGYTAINGKIIDEIVDDECTKKHGYLINEYFKEVQNGEIYSMSGVAIRRKVFQNTGLFNESLVWYEDVEMFGRIGYAYPVALSLAHGYVYHRTASNKITDSIPILPEEHPLITFLQKQPLENIKQRSDWEYIHPYIDSLHLKFAGVQILSGDVNGARKSLLEVKNPQYQKRKQFLSLISWIPLPLLRWCSAQKTVRYTINKIYKKRLKGRKNKI